MNDNQNRRLYCAVDRFPLSINDEKVINGFRTSIEAKFITVFSHTEYGILKIIYQITRRTDDPSLPDESTWSITVNEHCIELMVNDLMGFFNEYVIKNKEEELISDKSEPSNTNILDERKDSNGSEKELSS